MPRPRSDIELRIVDAARVRFLEQGVEGASLRKIANDAGTNIGMVYYYFPTKDDLFFAVVEELYQQVLRDVEAAIAPDVPVPERVERLYLRVARLSDDELLVARLVVREALTSSKRFERLRARFQSGHIPLIASHTASHEPERQGQRYWDEPSTPLFPFGHGLSYTTFAYAGLRLDRDRIAAGEALTVALKAAGLTRAQFADIVDKRPDAEALKAIFETLSFNKARVLLTYWDWAARRTGPYARIAAN